jgi:lysophospholipid acyltransferase (LPLAT)-like uncharacterized protein
LSERKRKAWHRRASKALLRWLALKATSFVAFLIFLVARTWRVEIEGYGSVLREHGAGRRVIFAFGHGRMLPFVWTHRGRGVRVLISEHFDGEMITRVIEWFGFSAARGSATRGGARALLDLLRSSDHDLAVTPDGPKGPFLSVKGGLVYLAAKSGLPIIAASWDADRRVQFRSWDEFRVPLPFARIVVATAPARWIAEDATDEELEIERLAVEADLAECEAWSMRLFGRPTAPAREPARASRVNP